MRILTTGATGFIGGAVATKLIQKCENAFFTGRQPSHLDNYKGADLTKKEDVKALMEWARPDVIVHAAGCSTTLGEDQVSNIISAFNLASECPNKCRLICISSATVYGNESFYTGASENDMPNPASLYGATKLACENILTAFRNLGKIDLTILRPCAVVGEGATHGLLPAIEKKFDYGDEVELIGECPGSVKPYVHVDDLCDLIYHYIYNKEDRIVNVAGEGELSVYTIAQLYACLNNYHPKIKWTGKFWEGDNPLIKMKCTYLPFPIRSSFRAVFDTFTR